jgi:cob(I)alamin adenosyltransferase
MLYTRKGDGGTTKLFGCEQKRISKSSAVAEALGSLDEINSLLGLVKVRAKELGLAVKSLNDEPVWRIVHVIQHNLFIIQAELAGADKHLSESKIKDLEKVIDNIESEMPPIKSFFVSGGTELGAIFDYARTIARRAERRVVKVAEGEVGPQESEPRGLTSVATRQYLNRLSSALYALARYSNFTAGVVEESPTYE